MAEIGLVSWGRQLISSRSRADVMPDQQQTAGAGPLVGSEFWDALAPHHAPIENHYLNVPAIRRIMGELREPVLVVGGGHGLIVGEIQKAGLRCDGIDLSLEMIRHAKLRRGIALIHADARAMPIPDQTYETVIFATGVIDFTGDETAIKMMLQEARRVVRQSGTIFIAFYRLSAASENFMTRIGLLKNNTMANRDSFELFQLNPLQMVSWVAKKSGSSVLSATLLMLRMAAFSPMGEKRMTFRMQKILREISDPKSLILTVPERLPYRNEAEIRKLFERLGLRVEQLHVLASCYIVRGVS